MKTDNTLDYLYQDYNMSVGLFSKEVGEKVKENLEYNSSNNIKFLSVSEIKEFY